MSRPYVTGMLYATAAALGIGAFWPAAGAGVFALALIAFVATWVIRDGLPETPKPPVVAAEFNEDDPRWAA